MKMKLIALMLVTASCLFAASAYAAPVATGSLQEMTYQLPADSGKLYLSVTGSKTDRQYQELRGLFATHPEFVEARGNYHYTPLAKESTMHAARYSRDYRDYPTVRLQTPDGSVVREWAGREIPPQDDLLAELKAECFRRRKPTPQPQPEPMPEPQPYVAPAQPREQTLPVWVYAAALFGGIGVRAVQDLREAVNS